MDSTWFEELSCETFKRIGYHPTQEIAEHFYRLSRGKVSKAVRFMEELWESAVEEVANSREWEYQDALRFSIEKEFLELVGL